MGDPLSLSGLPTLQREPWCGLHLLLGGGIFTYPEVMGLPSLPLVGCVPPQMGIFPDPQKTPSKLVRAL